MKNGQLANPAFDYSALDSEARVVVQQKTGEIRDRMSRAATNIVEIGERLIAVKGSLTHGQFTKWLGAEFDWSERAARRMMEVAGQFKTANLAEMDVAPSALYLLASPSTPAATREKFIEQAKSGKKVTHKEVKAEVKPEPKPAPARLPNPDDVPVFHNDTPAPKHTGNGQAKPAPEKQPETATVKDEAGTVITSPKIIELFQRRGEVTELMTAVSRIKGAIRKGVEKKDPLFAFINPSQVEAACNNVHRELRYTRPYAVCPYCGATPRGCKVCRGTGAVNETTYKNYTPEDLKV